MLRFRALLALLLFVSVVFGVRAETVLVYSAHRGLDSRIYLVREDGSSEHFHYPNTRLTDMTVVDGEVYVSDAFIPTVLRVDLATGELHRGFTDLSLMVHYALAHDGEHFYLKEWNLRRYASDGAFAGSTSYDDDAMGMTFDGEHLYVLNKDNQISAWDVSAWPEVEEVPERSLSAPSKDCRGLWWDGEAFWSAESKDSGGKIFRFGRRGQVLREIAQPMGRGWGAVVVRRAGE